MALKCGIVGLPNVGKSTLFNALSNAKALAANYPFATKEPNIGTTTVPDERLDRLNELANPQRVVPTTVEIVDIAGLIKGASKGEGLGNQFLGNIREVNAIVHVVRCFEDGNVVHVDGSVDPVRDKEVIDTELILKDIDTVEKRLDRLRKSAKSAQKSDLKAVNIAENILTQLNDGKPARVLIADLDAEEFAVLDEMQLLTAKPIIYVCNVDEQSVVGGNEHTKRFLQCIQGEDAQVIFVSAAIEADIQELETYEERMEFIRDMGLDEPGVNKLIRACYTILNLITYFTVGEKEVRAWTVTKGSLAPQAAGVIHSDFEKGFIRAEVIHYADFIKYGSEAACREAGKLAVEGKEYLVLDGDIMHFRFNV
jgi:GTP-binding protein YchF